MGVRKTREGNWHCGKWVGRQNVALKSEGVLASAEVEN